MHVIELLLALRRRNVKVWTTGGELRVDAPPDALDGPLREQLDARRDEIRDYLEGLDDTEHTTRYVPMRDGVRLAVDLFRPKRAGEVVATRLPVIWCHDRYRRSALEGGLLRTKLDTRPWLKSLMHHGYVVAAVDARGTGASSGTRTGEFSAAEVRDAYDVTEWLAAQDWCTGAVGMFGDSYLAISQLLAAGMAPPHLKAIFPQMPLFDLYSFLYPGGVFRHDFAHSWGEKVRELDSQAGAAPVAGQVEAGRRVLAEHTDNDDVFRRAAAGPYRDSPDPDDGSPLYQRYSPANRLEAINASGIPVYQLSGWYDMWARDAILWHTNLTVPRKLTIGGTSHTGREGIDMAVEHQRWFDHWLKGSDNGVPDEAPIRYWTINAPAGREWRTADRWPPPATATRFHLAGGGELVTGPPPAPGGLDEYVVDYTTTSGRTTRWVNGYGGDFGYEPMNANDAKALTYTTAPLERDMEVTGHPMTHLQVTSTHPDGDFFVYLEDVDPEGKSHYVTEGVVRASCRTPGEAPYDNLGLPYFPCAAGETDELCDFPAGLVLDLHPTSYLFRAGHRLRIAVTCCDRDNASTPVHQPPPVVQLHSPSFIELPVITG